MPKKPPDNEQHQVFDHRTFDHRFRQDLSNTRALLLLQSPFARVRRVEILRPNLAECVRRGVRLCIFLQKPRKESSEEAEATYAAVKLLVSIGAHVTMCKRIHEKLCIMDEDLFWDGSLNILSYYDTSERMTRWRSRAKVREAIELYGFACAANCATKAASRVLLPDATFQRHEMVAFGRTIAERRKLLGMSQRQLAEQIGLQQKILCEVEVGKRDAHMSTVLKICERLHIGLRSVPWFLLPSLDESIRDR